MLQFIARFKKKKRDFNSFKVKLQMILGLNKTVSEREKHWLLHLQFNTMCVYVRNI